MADHDEYDDETPAPRRLRVIPLTMTMLSLMFVVQLNEIYNDSLKLRSVYGVRDATASDAKPAPDSKIAGDKQKAQDAAATTTKDPATAGNDGTPSAEDKANEAASQAAKTDAKPAEGGHGEAKEGEGKPPEEPRTYGTGKSTVKQIEALKAKDTGPRYSQTEVDLLENLSKRRDELDRREKDLEIKSKVLEATDKRINDKLVEMKALETQLSKTVALYNEKQSTQIDSLVKIYSNMKPVDAANIFNQLDMPILLEVISKMSERKVSPVLAAMDPKKARDVTEELAAMRKSNAKAATGSAPGQAKP